MHAGCESYSCTTFIAVQYLLEMPKRKANDWPAIPGWVPYIADAKRSKANATDTPKEKTKEQLESEKLEVPPDWKEPTFTREDNPHGRLFAESSLEVRFPAYRENYLKSVWPSVKSILQSHHLRAELVLLGEAPKMVVRTTPSTFDPAIILCARDMLRLLARSMELTHAQKVLQVGYTSDIIDIALDNKERFERRRARLIGAEETTLQAMELLTGCNIAIVGKSVACVGTHRGCKEVREIVEACIFKNILPEYTLRVVEIKRELAKRPEMKDKSWDQFLPKLKKKNVQRKKPFKVRQKKEYEPLPDFHREPRKEDKALEEGTYFLFKKEQDKKRKEKKRQKKDVLAKKLLHTSKTT